MSTPLKVGDVIQAAESDYMYGQGQLTLRVTEVGAVQQHNDGPWVSLVGYEVYPSGAVAPHTRHALVRVRGMKRLP